MPRSLLAPRRTFVFALLGFFMLSALAAQRVEMTGSANAAAPQKDCSDAGILAAFQAKDKANSDFDGLHNRINPQIINGKFVLRGCVNNKPQFKQLGKIARKASCNREVMNEMKIQATGCGTCGPNQKRCGDICIGSTETCNLIP